MLARSNSDRSPLYDVRNHAIDALVRARNCGTMFSRTIWLRVLPEARLRSFELRRAHFDSLLRGCATRSLQAKRGGARRDRTDDLMLAKHALSQLSYGPVTRRRMLHVGRRDASPSRENALDQMVGLGRLELPTSRLSSARSNQLSYKPLTLGA